MSCILDGIQLRFLLSLALTKLEGSELQRSAALTNDRVLVAYVGLANSMIFYLVAILIKQVHQHKERALRSIFKL